MKWILFLGSVVMLLGATTAIPAYPQGDLRLLPNNNLNAQRPRHYDLATVETISGKVVRVDRVTSQGRKSGTGVHLSVETSQETVDVHLGPSWYLDEQPLRFKAGDQVEVTGSRVTDASKPALIAATVKSGDQVLTLRDKDGLPTWRGMGRGRGTGRGQWKEMP